MLVAQATQARMPVPLRPRGLPDSALFDIDRYWIEDPMGSLSGFDLRRGDRLFHTRDVMNVNAHRYVFGAIGAEVIHDVISPRCKRRDSLRVLARPMSEILDGMGKYNFRHNISSWQLKLTTIP